MKKDPAVPPEIKPRIDMLKEWCTGKLKFFNSVSESGVIQSCNGTVFYMCVRIDRGVDPDFNDKYAQIEIAIARCKFKLAPNIYVF